MSKIIKIRKGLNINLKGEAERKIENRLYSPQVAIKPPDFYGIIPKLKVKIGEHVLAGEPIFFSKKNPEILFTTPVSGKIKNILRGEKRRILEIIIEVDKEITYKKFKKANPLNLSAIEISETLLQAGLWPGLIQRPYAIIANPKTTPKSIFVSGFKSSPLSPDIPFILKQNEKEFQTGLDVLSKLTNRKVYLNLKANTSYSKKIEKAKHVKICYFKGPYPADNVGTQINKLDPINKGEIVWCVEPYHVVNIGKLFIKGIYDATKIITLTGSGVKKPKYYSTVIGINIDWLLKNQQKTDKRYRIISGNVFNGTKQDVNGYLGYYDSQITVIPEGNYFEFLGWLNFGFKKFSFSKTFFSWLTPKKKYDLSTRINGDVRAFVFSGQYEKVFPMDIHPVFLLKAILAEDIDKMEQLGIYEVAPEDFAACEFICTSKINVQQIVREGLDLMIKEML